jgi:basic amino acid/polyamine antiporter, APA family
MNGTAHKGFRAYRTTALNPYGFSVRDLARFSYSRRADRGMDRAARGGELRPSASILPGEIFSHRVNGTDVPRVTNAAPRPALQARDAVGLIVGIVIGAGIFSVPALVATHAGSASAMLLAWGLGGLISLAGAMCYAELATMYPHPGGDYLYLKLAFGRAISFLFAWARLTVIPTGSIALLAFVFGDYASQIVSFGEHSSASYAALLVILLTALNVAGLKQGKSTQNLLTSLEVLGIGLIIFAGLLLAPVHALASPAPAAADPNWGLVLVFVMLAYGGWNEAAYISAELRRPQRNIARSLCWSIAIVTTLYLLLNLAYLNTLGLSGMSESQAVAADAMRLSLGEAGARLVSLFIAVAAITSANATILMGARATFAFGRDFKTFSALTRWQGTAPVNALLVQGGIALALVLLGALTRSGFETMVEYTAPVFWFFFLLAGLALFVLRLREPEASRPFRVPLYPLTPFVFCATSAYLLYASVMYTGIGALVGLAVLACGLPALWLTRRQNSDDVLH